MPSRQQVERVIGEIKELSEEYAFERIDEERVALAPYGRGTEDGFFFWGELTQAQMRDALANGIDWEGFTKAQEQDVIRRVIDGQAPEFWMDGIDMHVPRDKRPAESMSHEELRNWPTAPGRLTRPGPEETPMERVERQIGHIKLAPDPYDFSIEELGPWDTGVSEDWQRLPEAEKLSRLVSQVDWRNISPEDKHRLLGREVDLTRLDAQAELIADFHARIEGLKRDGVPSYPPLGGRRPWPEAPETAKLEQIIWESTNVWLGTELPDVGAGPPVIRVPGRVALEMVERHVDYGGLLPAQRERLEALRTGLDAGRLGEDSPAGEDPVALGLARAMGIGDFEERLKALKDDEERPWAEVPEDVRVRVLVELATETGPPGAYVLEVIAREVDPARLPKWRRKALAGLLDQLNCGALDGENPNPGYQGDRADLALRLSELEARIEDLKHIGGDDPNPGRYRRWSDLAEEAKLNEIMWEARELNLEFEPAVYAIAAREVDLVQLPEETRREFEEGWAGAWPRPEGGQDAIRDTTHNLLEAIALDAWPRAAAIIDFGLGSQDHYEALYYGVRSGEITPEALDAALGRGDRLTSLARAAASNPHRDIEFHTSWDALRGREEPAGPEAPDSPPGSARGEAQPGVRVETPQETDERHKYLLFKGAPMPEGWTLPAWRDPPGHSDPEALRRAGGEAVSLAEARFESWRPVPFEAGAAAVPGATGRWEELTDFGKLDVMQHWVNWDGVSVKDRAATMAARLDLDKLPPDVRDRLTRDAGLEVQEAGRQETATVENKTPLSPGEIAAAKSAGPEHGGTQPHRRLPTPSEIAGDSPAHSAESRHGPEPDRGNSR